MSAPWAKEEVEEADLGDERLYARLEQVLSALGNRPNLSIPAACGGRAERAGAYRFFNNDKVAFDKVLQPHIARTVQRVAALSPVARHPLMGFLPSTSGTISIPTTISTADGRSLQ